jgi:hypothetical protein
MKRYDFNKARDLIETTPNVISASLGMYEDWWWTAETVFEDGKFTKELNEETKICSLTGSNWATPALQLCFSDGTQKMIEVSIGQGDAEKPDWLQLGVLSQPCQDKVPPLE